MYNCQPSYINMDKVHEILHLLRGEHDFASFSFRPTNAFDTIRNIDIHVRQETINPMTYTKSDSGVPFDVYQFHFKSTSFLHNQIRRIMGAVISYAAYDSVDLNHIKRLFDEPSPLSWTGKLLVAEPWGLFLSRICFDPKFNIKTDNEELSSLIE